MKIYIDNDFKCHHTDMGGLTQIETGAFEGKCAAYIEGYLYIPAGAEYPPSSGKFSPANIITPWKTWDELDAVQREYERVQYSTLRAQNAEYESALTEIEAALEVTTT